MKICVDCQLSNLDTQAVSTYEELKQVKRTLREAEHTLASMEKETQFYYIRMNAYKAENESLKRLIEHKDLKIKQLKKKAYFE